MKFMQLAFLLLSVAHFIFPACYSQQAIHVRVRSASQPTIDLHQFDIVTLIENFQKQLDDFNHTAPISQRSSLQNSPGSEPSKLLSKRTIILPAAIVTAGLTAKYLWDVEIKNGTKFDPITILAGAGLAKALLGGSVALVAGWAILKQMSNSVHAGCIERERRIKFEHEVEKKDIEATYKEKAKELKESFEKLKEHLARSLDDQNKNMDKRFKDQENHNKVTFDTFKKSIGAEYEKHKLRIEAELLDAQNKIQEATDAIQQLREISKSSERSQKELKECAEIIKNSIEHALERYKKCLKLIAKIPDKLIDAKDKHELHQEILGASESLQTIRSLTPTIDNLNIVIPSPKTPGFIDRIASRLRSGSRGGHSRSSSQTQFDVSTFSRTLPITSQIAVGSVASSAPVPSHDNSPIGHHQGSPTSAPPLVRSESRANMRRSVGSIIEIVDERSLELQINSTRHRQSQG